MVSLDDEEKRIKNLQIKLSKSLSTIDSDLEREKSISLDATLNEKRILEEKNELLKTEKQFYETETIASENLSLSKNLLNELKNDLEKIISEIEVLIDSGKKIDKDIFLKLKNLIGKITNAQEEYAVSLSKNESIKNDSIKRSERIKNIDIELENWKSLKTNSEKMTMELTGRKEKIKIEIEENQKNPEKIATNKGQNIQNLENTKKEMKN